MNVPAAKKKALKSRTSKTAKSKKSAFKFKWWMALLLVLIVGGVGFIVFRQSYAYRDCRTTPRGAICGGGPVQFRISDLQYRPGTPAADITFYGHFPNNFNPGVSEVCVPYQCDQSGNSIFQLSSRENTECGKISRNNPFGYKSGQNVGFYTGNDLRYGISYAWWTPVGC